MYIWVLTVLKVAGVTLGLASVLWGMTRKISIEDHDGQKRLTPAGHVAVALALGSFLVAAASQGFEILARQAEERVKLQKIQADAAERQANAAQQLVRDQRAQRTEDLVRLAAATTMAAQAEDRAARAEERLLVLNNEQAARGRDLALSRDVNRGSRENLNRTTAALDQLDRVLQPIDQMELRVTWRAPVGDRLPELAQYAAALKPGTTAKGLVDTSWDGDELISMRIDRTFPFFPGFRYARDVSEAISDARARVGFWDPAASADRTPNVVADLSFAIEQYSVFEGGLDYYPSSKEFVFRMRSDASEKIVRSGRIVSINDIPKAAVTLQIEFPEPGDQADPAKVHLLDAMRPTLVTLRVSGRSYTVTAGDIRHVMVAGHPMFVFMFSQTDLERARGPRPSTQMKR